MAQDHETTKTPDKYGKVGDEVASVLASARTASVEVRNQAIRYAESLVASAREEIAEMRRDAEADANRTVGAAEMRARNMIRDARRQVLEIVEAAQTRVAEAEAAEQAAMTRRGALLVLEAELINRISSATSEVESRVDKLRNASHPGPEETGATPMAQIQELLEKSNAAADGDRPTSQG